MNEQIFGMVLLSLGVIVGGGVGFGFGASVERGEIVKERKVDHIKLESCLRIISGVEDGKKH